MERNRKAVSKYAAGILSTRCYEGSLYEEVLADELWHWQNMPEIPLSVALLHPKPAPKKLSVPDGTASECLVPASVKLRNGVVCKKVDVCLLQSVAADQQWGCGQAWCHDAIRGHLCSVVSVWSLQQSNPETHTALWTERDDPMFLETSIIFASVVHCKSRTGVRTLVPYHLRRCACKAVKKPSKDCLCCFVFLNLTIVKAPSGA